MTRAGRPRLIPRGLRLGVWRVVRLTRQFFQRFRVRRNLRSAEAAYCAEPPSNQTAIDIFRGTWASAFPPEYGVTAGAIASFDDVRVRWAAGILPGGFKNLSILELGPYEAYTTWQFDRLGAKAVTAIEGNDLNFLKALVVKEVTGFRGKLLFGDFAAFLERTPERFDLVWASGVLYHSSDPLRLLDLIARVTDVVFIHTHYYAPEISASSAHAYSFFEPSRNRTARIDGRDATLHYKAYGQLKRGTFSGGAADYSYWLERDDIFAALRSRGFTDIQIGADDPGNPNGPAMFCLARRIR
jgi:SAM-dependent methyltransferase